VNFLLKRPFKGYIWPECQREQGPHGSQDTRVFAAEREATRPKRTFAGIKLYMSPKATPCDPHAGCRHSANGMSSGNAIASMPAAQSALQAQGADRDHLHC